MSRARSIFAGRVNALRRQCGCDAEPCRHAHHLCGCLARGHGAVRVCAGARASRANAAQTR